MTFDPRVRALDEVRTEPLFDIVVDLSPKQTIGPGPVGHRTLFGAAGGSFEGPRLRGHVLAGGGDWALFRSDGVMMLDVRLTLKTHDGALIMMTYGGRWVFPTGLREAMADISTRHQIDPAGYYFRTNPVFETGAKQYAWLNDVVCIGQGYLIEGGVAYKISRVV
jgi:hypothetical protein